MKDFKNKEEKRTLNENNRITVRIWLPKVKNKPSNAYKAVAEIALKNNENANVGHVSIATPNLYASIWPDPSDPVTKLFKVVKPDYHTLEKDIEDEGKKEPDVIVCLYSLNIQAIENAFDDVKKLNSGYTLTGDNSVTEGKGQSCASLALFLLKRGGLGEPTILPVNISSIMKVVVEPNEFKELIYKAKKIELETYDCSQIEYLENEYRPEEKSSSCALV